VVTAVKAETRAVLAALTRPTRIAFSGIRAWGGQAGGRSVTLIQAGIGPVRARAALLAVTIPHRLVISIGFAGALVMDASPGDIVLPDTVVWEDGAGLRRYTVPAGVWRTAKSGLPADLAIRTLQGPLLSSPVVVATPAAKRAAALRCGAVAVEMETAALVAIASERGVDVLVLRAILDTVDISLEGLPPDLDSSWVACARLVARPGAWPGVLNLTRRIPHVARALTRATAAVLSAL
jgi:adenosylhomocysteine nucleosidase